MAKKVLVSTPSKVVAILGVIAALVVLLSLAIALVRGFKSNTTVLGDQYQAVFLNDGRVYMGKLDFAGDDYATLTDVYYLQAAGEGDGQDLSQSLRKYGDEVRGPEDKMFINIGNLVTWENLKDDSQVVQAIRNR